MGSPSAADVLGRRENAEVWPAFFAQRLSLLLEAGTIEHSMVVSWADRQIARLSAPPTWMLDLSLTRSAADAVAVLRQFESSARELPGWSNDDCVGALYRQARSGNLSWEQFLERACMTTEEEDYFCPMWAKYERSGFDPAVEAEQWLEIEAKYREVTESIERTIECLRK